VLSSWTYLAFVSVSLAAYWLLVPRAWRTPYLAAVSFAYFFAFAPREMLFLLVLALAVYAGGLLVRPGRAAARVLAWVMVAGLVGQLAYFKYAGFLQDILADVGVWPVSHAGAAAVFVPVGVSYFTFKMVHYVIDLRQGRMPRHGLFHFLSYIFFFPILVSGPIERFQPFQGQAAHASGFSPGYLWEGLPRIVGGLFKKVVLADSLAATASLLQQPDLLPWHYWMATYAYSLQLYFDFSGYSDMAIGVSRLFGYTIMENFDWPYLARNISEFWKRWHKSLTGWFRDYVFIPLGGSRGSAWVTARNTLVVMSITGLWHGAGWHFIYWGLYHAAGLLGLRLHRRWVKPLLLKAGLPLQHWLVQAGSTVLTFHFVALGWVFFACDARQSLYVAGKLFGW
jgi:alginate O-acetyltransferase complex protein AlgI